MSHEVYANGNEIAGKAGMNKVIASFPDVCLSPPTPPAGPIPIPYPNTSFSSDLKEGSTSVKLGGAPAALAQQSYFQPSVLGDEAATRTLGMNVINHTITGKTYFQAWSMDVQIEGKNVCRHVDITTSNHASAIAGAPTPNPGIEKMTMATLQSGKCACCGNPLHDNQRNTASMTEEEWYGTDDKSMDELAKKAEESMKSLKSMKELSKTAPASAQKSITDRIAKLDETASAANEAYYKRQELKDALAEARASGCKNVPAKPDEGCGTYMALLKRPQETDTGTGAPRVDAKGDPVYKDLKAEWDGGGRAAFVSWYNTTNPSKAIPRPAAATEGMKIHHATPVAGGGCPLGGNPSNNYENVVPDQDISARCREIDDEILGPAQAQSQKRHLVP